MNDQQILAIVLASAPTMLTVLIGMLVNNARLSDMKSDINARLGDLNARFAETNARIGETNARIAETNGRIAEVRTWICALTRRRSYGALSCTASKRSSTRA